MTYLQILLSNKKKKLRLKTKIKGIENVLNRSPLLMTPLEIQAQPLLISTLVTSHIFDKHKNILNAMKTYIICNICKILQIIEHA